MKKSFLIIALFSCFILPNKFAKADSTDVKAPCHTISLSGNNISCYGYNNGSVNLTINGGSGNFSITWSNGASDVYSISNLTAGYYDVQVVDNTTGCSAFALINLTEPDELTTSLTAEDVGCYGESTGAILMNIDGGTLPYTINWSNSVTTQNNLNIPAGDYDVTVTDKHDCVATNSASVSQPAQALGSSYAVTDILCNNDSNGKIDVTVWGGTPPYTYNWNENAYNSQDLSDIPSGTYNLVIEDLNNCPNTHTIQVANPAILSMTNTVVDNLCYGENLGEINLSVSGGTGNYFYSWANSELLLSYDTPLIEDLPNETYFVTVTDENDCTIEDNFEITSPTEIIPTIVSTDVSSFGGTDGQIDLTVSGGVPSYIFSWSNGVSSEDNLNITAGFYEVTITDQNNCKAYASTTIYEPLEPLSFSYISKNTSCYGSDDGEIFTYPSGGTKPYSYSWSTGDTLSYLTDLQAGIFIFTLIDAQSIEFTDTIEIFQPEPFSFSYTPTQPTCFGFSDGIVILDANGGTQPYTYSWYDSEFALAGLTRDLNNISAGEYTVVVKDTMGCEGNFTVSIEEPEKLIISLTEDNVQCAGGSTGSIHTNVTGGTTPYNYLWSNGEITPDLIDISAGTYSITVYDKNGCLQNIETQITEPDSISIELSPNEVSCIHQSDGYITSSIDGGSGGYNFLWSNNETSENIYNLVGGEYSLIITDIFGCTSEKSTFVITNQEECISIPTTFTPNGDNINDDWAIKNIYLYPDCNLQIFNSWGSIVYESIGYSVNWDGTYNGNPLPAGTYYYILILSKNIEPYKGTVTIIK